MQSHFRRYSLAILAIAIAAALATVLGAPEEIVNFLAGALSALILVSLYESFERPKQ